MGCISSQPAHSVPTAKQQPPSPATAAQASSPSQTAAKHAVAAAPKKRNTAVLRQANLFDKLDADAHKEPSLKDVRVHVGEHNKKLLNGFEEKHRLAHAPPVLQDVQRADLRASKLFHTLREYEMNDERARNEPKLQTTFTQREKEPQQNK